MMDKMDYDVIIVGAGPAGSIAARTIAENNFKVLVIEKKQEIGTPKRCAEGINIEGLKNVGLKPNPLWAINKINGAVLYSPSGKSIRAVFEDMSGFVLERKIFEKHLAADAIRKGAKYMVKTRAIEVIKDNGFVNGIKVEYMGEVFDINARIVIAADGVDSRIARSAGINTINALKDYHSGFQYEMAGIDNIDGNLLHLYFGEKIAPKGYVWIFPKGKDVANVGIGILSALSDEGSRAKDYLDRFIESHPEIFKNASPIEINAGGIPVGGFLDTLVDNGFMVVGDAAHQVNPIHGGGIALAMDAGKIAGNVASDALSKGNVSKESLYEYQRLWEMKFGNKLKSLLRLRSFLERVTDDEFEIFADILSGEDIIKLTKSKYRFLIKLLMKKAPHMLPLAKRFLS